MNLFRHVFRRFFIILALMLLFFGAGSYASWYLLNHYRAEAVLVFQQELPETMPAGLTLHPLSVTTAVDLITLPNQLQTVKTHLGLDLSLKELEKMVTASLPQNGSHLIRIHCTSDNPNLSIAIVNSLAKIAVRRSREFKQKQLQEAHHNFKMKLTGVSGELANILKDIEQFKKVHHYFEMTADYATLAAQIKEAQAQLHNATLHSRDVLAETQTLKHEMENLPDQIAVNVSKPVNANLPQITSLESKLGEAKARYAPQNPKIKMLQDELESLKSQSTPEPETLFERNAYKEKLKIELGRLESRGRVAQKNRQELQSSLSMLERELESLPANQMTFTKLLHNKQALEERVASLNQAVASIDLMQNAQMTGLELYQEATSAKRYGEAWWVELLPLLGLFSGALLGLVFWKRL